MDLDVLCFLYVRCFPDRPFNFPVHCFSIISNDSETKNRTLEEIELIFNSGAAGQLRRVFHNLVSAMTSITIT
jgi:hypothetical protein